MRAKSFFDQRTLEQSPLPTKIPTIGTSLVGEPWPKHCTLHSYMCREQMPQSSRNRRDWSQPQLSASSNPTLSSLGEVVNRAKHTFQTSFQFVANDDVKNSRQSVRKHVMLEFRRRERWESENRKEIRGADEVDAPKRRNRISKISSASSLSSEKPPMDNFRLPHTTDLDASESLIGYTSGEQYQTSHGDESEDIQVSDINITSPTDTMALDNADDYLRYHADPWAAVAQSKVNPFSTINFNVGPSTQFLLYFCKPTLILNHP